MAVNQVNKHVSVLLNETLEALAPAAKPNTVFVDCTLGGAGHSAALLEKHPDIRLLACDVDTNAISKARERLKPFGDRVDFYHGNFSNLVDVDPITLPERFRPPWSGMLADLGFSSNQLESPEYGMSFMREAPLDMRLSRQGDTAWDLLQDSTAQELGDILKAYGEMPGAHRLAQRILNAISQGEVENSTSSLAGFLERIAGGRKKGKIHPATLVFQALRIAVNDELRALDHFLEGAILKLNGQGRIALITFHSLEDRIVKRWGQAHEAELRAVTKKPIIASDEENKINPRARSAKLRVYERI